MRLTEKNRRLASFNAIQKMRGINLKRRRSMSDYIHRIDDIRPIKVNKQKPCLFKDISYIQFNKIMGKSSKLPIQHFDEIDKKIFAPENADIVMSSAVKLKKNFYFAILPTRDMNQALRLIRSFVRNLYIDENDKFEQYSYFAIATIADNFQQIDINLVPNPHFNKEEEIYIRFIAGPRRERPYEWVTYRKKTHFKGKRHVYVPLKNAEVFVDMNNSVCSSDVYDLEKAGFLRTIKSAYRYTCFEEENNIIYEKLLAKIKIDNDNKFQEYPHIYSNKDLEACVCCGEKELLTVEEEEE